MYTGVCDSRNPYPVLQWCLTHAGWITSTQKQQPFYPQSHSVNSLGKEQANFPSYSCLLQNKHDIPFQSHCYSRSQLPSLPMEEKKKKYKAPTPTHFYPLPFVSVQGSSGVRVASTTVASPLPPHMPFGAWEKPSLSFLQWRGSTARSPQATNPGRGISW